MSKRATTLIAALFAAGLLSGSPAWADRGNARFDHRNVHPDRGNVRFDRGRGHVSNAWGLGLGLLAGSAILLAATQPGRVVAAPPLQVYAPPPPVAVYSPPTLHWWYYCAQSAGYYPYVNYCPSGWTKAPATPLP
ncbi:MAG: hypothetical protein WCV99_24120 [Sterolibacterium sp.]|jgi:hypothetical protein